MSARPAPLGVGDPPALERRWLKTATPSGIAAINKELPMQHPRIQGRARLLTTLLVVAWATVVAPLAQAAPKTAPAASKPSTSATSTPAAAPSPEAEPPKAAPSPGADERAEALNNAVYAMSSIQSFLEFYFMETGQYPDALVDMLSQYNQGVRQGEPLVKIPTDPATGRKFIYAASEDRTKYTLRAPEPAAYGLGSLQIHQVDWGWMASIASEQKKKRLTMRCVQFMQMLANVVEEYNKANRNRFPDSIDKLIPKYLQKVPTCPLCKKPYQYAHSDRGFEVICPEPKVHGLDDFRFSSTEGLKKLP
ncbi:MAG: hypothetical protein EB084_17385 [Proteobacteria bacterium]|nr:hypothetical protein [Pseudomonadota bacterium]